jgi:hypothetical protein
VFFAQVFEEIGRCRVGELRSLLSAFSAEDLTVLPAGVKLERIALLVAVQNQIAAEVTRSVRDAEATQAAEHDGLKSMRSWLIGHARLAPAEAMRMVRSGRVLEHFPALAAGFAEGSVTAAQVNVVAEKVGPTERAAAAEQGIDLAAFDEAWAAVAAEAPHQVLAVAVQAFDDALDPDGVEPDPTEGRRFSIAKHADGSVTGRFDLDAVGGEKVQAAIEAIVQANRPKGDDRTRGQQNADAFVQLCDNQLASGELPTLRTKKPHVVLGIDLEDLVDPSTGRGTGDLGFGAVISAARARWLARDTDISRMVMGPDGQPLDLGREHRVVTPGLRRAVERRDKSCVFAGCGAPTWWCDVHHSAIPRGPRRACESWGGGGPSAHEGASRVPGRATTRWPMAHLATRRHRDPARHTPARLTAPRCSARRVQRQRRPRLAGPRSSAVLEVEPAGLGLHELAEDGREDLALDLVPHHQRGGVVGRGRLLHDPPPVVEVAGRAEPAQVPLRLAVLRAARGDHQRARPVLLLAERAAVEVPGHQPVRRGQYEQEARHPRRIEVGGPVDAVGDAEQWQDAPAQRPRGGLAPLRPVEHQGGDPGVDPGGAPRPARNGVAPTDDVGELRPPPRRVVEGPAGQLVPQREDPDRPARGPLDHHRAHAGDPAPRHPAGVTRLVNGSTSRDGCAASR